MERRKTIAIVSLVVAVACVALVMSMRQERQGASRSGADPVASRAASAARSIQDADTASTDAGGTRIDRARRDEIRRQIVAAWSASTRAGDPPAAEVAEDTPIPPMPTGADGRIDAQYIKDVVKADLMPLVRKCHEELTTRKPGAEGRISLAFRIVGDEKIGGIVDDASLAADAGTLAADDRFAICVRESTMSLSFRPPPQKGSVVVPVTMVFTNHDD